MGKAKAIKAAGAGASKLAPIFGPAGIGAAIASVLASERGRTIVCLVLAFALIFTCFLIESVPNLTYEVARRAFDDAADHFYVAFHDDSGSTRFSPTALAKTIIEDIKTAFRSIANLLSNEKDPTDGTNLYSDDNSFELGVFANEDDLGSTLSSKVDRTVKRIESRIEGLSSYCENTDYPERIKEDELYGQAFFFCKVKEPDIITQQEALKLICLYSVLFRDLTENYDYPDNRLVDYLKWLGYYDEAEPPFEWQGTYLPQKELINQFVDGSNTVEPTALLNKLIYINLPENITRDVVEKEVFVGLDEAGQPMYVTVYYVTYTYEIQNKTTLEIIEDAGLWEGVLTDDANWISPSGSKCSIVTPFQTEYFDDMYYISLCYMGLNYEAGHLGNDIVEVAYNEYLLHKNNTRLCGGEKYWSGHYSSQVNWCSCFVYWCAESLGYTSQDFFGPYTGDPNASWAYFKELNQTVRVEDTDIFGSSVFTPQKGDLIYYSKTGSNLDHIGIVKEYDGKSLITIEGNTSPSRLTGHYSNGENYVVWQKDRLSSKYSLYKTYGIYGFARPIYP